MQMNFITLAILSNFEDPNARGVSEILPGHQAEVNCVKFMRDGDLIASGDQSGVLQIRAKTSVSSVSTMHI
jgi:WD40 repeat protein